MNVFDYVVVNIEGDYANLRRIDNVDEELKLVARALLPEEITEGTKLHYEYMEYTII
ncbi:chorismate--pyruvate lyase [Kineothrix sp. MB12-C1]|uniref:chorismate--pyruvate lyase n=1 Tax=Kineothrix sp. MB12-C1 TaxID=3070215 RepID=UPI0027D231AB|nr:chorismate--pyruvate lyase [Kineothrix sp. MB12-C1]WMC91955.1 chorismate--pyruvate lyase [Kineothrix sp. MB12-C1]